MIKINIEEKKILTENIDINDIILGKFNRYKNERFSEVLKAVENKIKTLTKIKALTKEERKTEFIRDVNESLWVDSGVNFIFDGFVYGEMLNLTDNEGQRAQLYSTNSAVNPKQNEGWASFSNSKTKAEWETNFGNDKSFNPLSSNRIDAQEYTLTGFYKRLTLDAAKIKFKGKEIDFQTPDATPDTAKNKQEYTVIEVISLFKAVMEGGENSIYTKAKTKAEAEVAAEERRKKEEEAPLEKGELASAEKYNIRRPKRVRVVKLFQTRALKRFYTNIKDPSLTKIIADYQAGKYLSDGFYGHRTHHTSREAIKYLIKAVNEAKKQGKAGIDYDNAMAILNGLDRAFAAAHDNPNKPKKNRFIQARFVDQLDLLLRLLQFKDGKISNLGVVGGGGKATTRIPKKKDDKGKKPESKGKKPIPAPPIARKPAPRPREASCWYAQNITFGGEQATSPNSLWARTKGVETFDQWHEKMMTVMNYAGYSASYTFRSGARASYRAQVETMGARRSTNINIQCFVAIGSALSRVLSALGNTAEMNHPKDPKRLSVRAKYFLNNGKYAGSLARECQVTLYKVVMNAMQNEAPKILRAAEKLKQGGQDKQAAVVAALAGTAQAKKVIASKGPDKVNEGLISDLIFIKVED